MQKIAKFEKVSKKQFVQDWLDTFTTATQAEAIQIYDQLQLPKRATIGSAGYDFFAPRVLSSNQENLSKYQPVFGFRSQPDGS